MFPQFIFEKALIRALNVLRQVTEKNKRWKTGIYLGYILYLDMLTLH
jgi:hypothetical protein